MKSTKSKDNYSRNIKRHTYKKNNKLKKKYIGGFTKELQKKHEEKILKKINELKNMHINDDYNFKTDENNVKVKVFSLIKAINIYKNMFVLKDSTASELQNIKNKKLYDESIKQNPYMLDKILTKNEKFIEIINSLEYDFEVIKDFEMNSETSKKDSEITETTSLLSTTKKNSTKKNTTKKNWMGSISKVFSKFYRND